MPTEHFPDGRTKKDGSPKRKPGRPPGDRNQRAAIEKIGRLAADVEKLIDDQIRLCEWTQGAVRVEITSRDGAKQQFVHEGDIAKLHAVTKMIGELVTAKSKFTHLAKFLGAGLTPDEVLEGAVQRILRQERATRLRLINRLIDGHNAAKAHTGMMVKERLEEETGVALLATNDPTEGPWNEPPPLKPPIPAAKPPRPLTALDAITALAQHVDR